MNREIRIGRAFIWSTERNGESPRTDELVTAHQVDGMPPGWIGDVVRVAGRGLWGFFAAHGDEPGLRSFRSYESKQAVLDGLAEWLVAEGPA